MNWLECCGTRWSCGWTTLSLQDVVAGATLPTSIECRVGGLKMQVLVDTGATFSVVSPAIADRFDGAEPTGEEVSFWRGQTEYSGEFWRVPVTFIAEEGEDLTFIAKFCVAEEWVRPAVLGVLFCLDALNLGLEPAARPATIGRLHFGPARTST